VSEREITQQLEATLCWGDQVLSVQHFAAPRAVTVGATDRADIFADASGHDDGPVAIVRCVDGRYLLALDPAAPDAVATDADGIDLASLPDATTTLAFGALTLQLRLVQRPAPIASWLAGEPNYGWLNVALCSLFVHAGLFTAAWLYPVDGHSRTDELLTNPGRITSLLVSSPRQPPTAPSREQRPGPTAPSAERFRLPEGKAGTPQAPPANRRLAFAGQRPNDDAIVAGKIASLFGTGERGLTGVFGTASGRDLIDALGNVTGPAVGAANGQYGLGPRGAGPGGGGRSWTTYGAGDIGTIGHGNGHRPYGTGDGALQQRIERALPIEQQTVIVGDALSRDLIRRVIREHVNEVRYCYERELQSSPGLWGKVQLRFVINASGGVQQTAVIENTLGGDAVANCVSGRVKTWRFPRPRGGGVVIVSYPFLFKQGN
jgi:hypothetical protein